MTQSSISVLSSKALLAAFGARDQHLRRIRDALGVRISTRDGRIHVEGDEKGVAQATELLEQLQSQAQVQGDVSSDDVGRMLSEVRQGEPCSAIGPLLTHAGRQIRPRTPGQAKYVAAIREQHVVFCIGPAGTGKTYLAVAAAVAALKKYPVLNASVDGNDIVYHGYFDIGIAVGSPRGLVVPILRNADQMSFADIEKKIAEFGQKAKDGKLSLDELSGGTFSISNGGVFGSMLSTPIINPPQSAILGVHATKDRAVVENGQIVIRPMNYLALSYDHRIIDGREAVLGLVAMKEALEDPSRLLFDI